jgi:hypothetical protein
MPPGLCPNVAVEGACTEIDCAYRYEAHRCDLCRISRSSQSTFNQHLQSGKHLRNLSGGPPKTKRCLVCNVFVVGGPHNIEQHERGARHTQGIAVYEGIGMPAPGMLNDEPSNVRRCMSCNTDISDNIWTQHVVSILHRRAERFLAYKVALEKGKKDKHGIVVEEAKLDFGIVQVDSLRQQPTVTKPFHLTLTESGMIRLTQVRMSSSVGGYAAFRQVK